MSETSIELDNVGKQDEYGNRVIMVIVTPKGRMSLLDYDYYRFDSEWYHQINLQCKAIRQFMKTYG